MSGNLDLRTLDMLVLSYLKPSVIRVRMDEFVPKWEEGGKFVYHLEPDNIFLIHPDNLDELKARLEEEHIAVRIAATPPAPDAGSGVDTEAQT